MVGRAKPRVFPFEELRVSGSLERRHRRTSSLSSRWIGLQSITHASSTLFGWVLPPCTFDPQARPKADRFTRASWSSMRQSPAAGQYRSRLSCPSSRVQSTIRKRVPANSCTANGTSFYRLPSREVLRLYDVYGQRQRPTPGLPHLAVLRPQAFSASRRFIPPQTSPALFHAGNAPELLPTEDSPFR